MRKCILKCTLICCLLCLSTMAAAKIIFISSVNDVQGIYVMDDDGDNITLLTDTLNPFFPRWSPNGKLIVFDRIGNGLRQQEHICLMNADGTNIRELTTPRIDGSDIQPSFSPDGKYVIFSRYEKNGNKNSIDLIDIVSGEVKQISDLNVQEPRFSPDGKEIICTTIGGVVGRGSDIVIMDADGNRARPLLNPAEQIADGKVTREDAVWSPDGKHILYTESHFGIERIGNTLHHIPKGFFYLICRRNGKTINRLKIKDNLRPLGLDWMDNGKAIVFCAYEIKLGKIPDMGIYDIPWHVYKYDIQSQKTTRLTDHHAHNFQPNWIDDNVLPVTPHGKKKVTLGTLKQ